MLKLIGIATFRAPDFLAGRYSRHRSGCEHQTRYGAEKAADGERAQEVRKNFATMWQALVPGCGGLLDVRGKRTDPFDESREVKPDAEAEPL